MFFAMKTNPILDKIKNPKASVGVIYIYTSMQVVSLTFNVMGVVKECLFLRLDKCVFFVL